MGWVGGLRGVGGDWVLGGGMEGGWCAGGSFEGWRFYSAEFDNTSSHPTHPTTPPHPMPS